MNKTKNKSLIVPKLKPRNFLGVKRKGTMKHKDKRRESGNILDEIQD